MPWRQELYTDKQKRKAQHIEEGYRERGVPKDEAERRHADRQPGIRAVSCPDRAGRKETHVASSRAGGRKIRKLGATVRGRAEGLGNPPQA